VQRERLALADLCEAVGPDAPTLCAGWLTRDLMAHLVMRESHLAAAGIGVPPLRRWAERTQNELAQRPYDGLVDRFRRGPARLSPLRLPGVQVTLNTFEHFVHHEDVRRAHSSWQPRHLSTADNQTLWQPLTARARLLLRDSPVPVRINGSDGEQITVGDVDSGDALSLSGAPSELVIYLHGRRSHAIVSIDGSVASQEAWSRHVIRI
jgi:uncharacterized protein (TIGR03085 family)